MLQVTLTLRRFGILCTCFCSLFSACLWRVRAENNMTCSTHSQQLLRAAHACGRCADICVAPAAFAFSSTFPLQLCICFVVVASIYQAVGLRLLQRIQ
jgi:hypothetical protein